jgi:NAD(P)-dependent dehydrogenase (short-subunit alcohol dehydrogenase family)
MAQREFTGKVVVVSGASRGIGLGIATAFAGEGAHVLIAASSPERLAQGASAIAAKHGVQPETCAADLRQPEGASAVHAAAMAKWGRCDILVNSAGATRAGAFLDLSEEAWQDGFALKFFGCVRLCRAFWPQLVQAQGFVVNVIGGAARIPDPEFMIGGAVNAAMWNFSKGLSGLGKRDGVNVNAILPGMTTTERIDQLFTQRAAASGVDKDELLRRAIEKDGTRRLGTPEDIAALTLFLCSERARHIQGTAIAVDGGATPGVY